jgi:Na+(H+)/acetate symporter ActP
MTGFSFLTLLKRNKDKIKLLVSALGAYGVSQIGLIQDANLNALLSTASGVVIYIIGASIDYYLTEDPGQEERVQAALVALLTTPKVGVEKGEPQ